MRMRRSARAEPLGLSRLAAFSSPAATIAALGLPIVIFLPPLYAELGLGLSMVGAIFMVTRFFDVGTDPIFGILGDKLNTRWGRRRPALIASVPILTYGVYRVFFPGESASSVDLLIAMLVLYVGWTMFTLAHTAWASELSANYDVRSRVMGTIQFFSLLGTIAVLLLPVTLDFLAVEATMRDRAAVMGLFILISLPLLTAAAVAAVDEPSRKAEPPLPWREALGSLLGNTPLRRLLAADLLLGIQGGINGSVHFFFVGQVLAMPEYASTYLIVLFVTGLVCVPLFLKLAYRLGKHHTLCIATLTTSIGTISLFFLPQHAFWLTFVVYLFVGVNVGAKDFLMRAIMADVIDQDRVNTGVDRSALYYSMLTLTAKVGLAASVGIIYPMLDLVGFDPTGVNSETTLTGVRVVVATSPTVLLFLVAVLMWRFPLDRRHQEALRAQLDA